MYKLDLEQFLKEVATHEVKIIQDNGMFRYIKFGKPNSNDMHFNLTTWPGFLAYTGDMGSYIFSRVPDMFEFFRDASGKYQVNPFYWSEKIMATDKYDSHEKFSWDKFKENLLAACETDVQKIWIKDEVKLIDQDEYGAVEFIRNFDNDNDVDLDLSDFWEYDNEEYSQRYIWCCYALVWGIQQYDKLKSEQKAAQENEV